jgi:hypothetical protein
MDSKASHKGSTSRGATAHSPHRRPYAKPELIAYGPLAKLTRSTHSGTGENTAQGAMKMR